MSLISAGSISLDSAFKASQCTTNRATWHLKGTVSRDILLRFFHESVPPAPEYSIETVSNFFETSWRYSHVKVHHRYQRHRQQICHRCWRKRQQKCRRYQWHWWQICHQYQQPVLRIQIRDPVPFRPLENRFFRISDPGSQTQIFEGLVTIFWVKTSIILGKLGQIFFFSISKRK